MQGAQAKRWRGVMATRQDSGLSHRPLPATSYIQQDCREHCGTQAAWKAIGLPRVLGELPPLTLVTSHA